jgi:hypothetical protein
MPSLDEEADDPPGTEYWTIKRDHVFLIYEALVIGLACAQRMRVTDREQTILGTALGRVREILPETKQP